MKRFWETTVVLVTMPAWLVAYCLVAALIALVDGLPVHFTQERAGLHGRPFRLIKFRSMRFGTGTDAERQTRLGRFLRATSLDELPQLWLVLTGKMSLVGPRPLPVAYLPRYSAEQRHRHDVRPGITGWAQVNGRNTLTWDQKFAYDLEYVRRVSFAFDVRILCLTVLRVFAHSGINHGQGETMPEFLG